MEFNIEQHAVSIRQKQKLLRLTRQWGEVRLAVEGQLNKCVNMIHVHVFCELKCIICVSVTMLCVSMC